MGNMKFGPLEKIEQIALFAFCEETSKINAW